MAGQWAILRPELRTTRSVERIREADEAAIAGCDSAGTARRRGGREACDPAAVRVPAADDVRAGRRELEPAGNDVLCLALWQVDRDGLDAAGPEAVD